MVKKSCFSFFSRKALTGFEPQANLGRIRTPVLPVALKSSTLSTSPTIVFQPPRNTVRYIWLKKVVSAFFSKGLGRIRTPGLPVALKSSTLSTSPTIVFRSPKNTVRYMVKKKFFRLFFSKGLGWIRTPDLRHSTNVANGDVPPTPYGLVPVASNFPRALSRIRYILDEFSIFV